MSRRFLALFLVLGSIFALASSARLLLDDQVEAQPQVVSPGAANPAAAGAGAGAAATNAALPSGQIPAAAAAVNPAGPAEEDEEEADPPVAEEETDEPVEAAQPVAPAEPDAEVPPPTAGDEKPKGDVAPAAPKEEKPEADAAPISGPAAGAATQGGAAAAAGNAAGEGEHKPTLSFFMHDVIGGSHPSARVVTGIIAQTEVNGVPFSKVNDNFFPVTGGAPLVNFNNINRIINPNTAPLLTGLRGAQVNNIVTNRGSSFADFADSENSPFVVAGSLPAGAALQQLMFGTITVIDDELTEGHELGSAVIGRAQGFYLASSLDGTSQTIATTILLHGEHGYYDEISFFGVHRTASHESLIAVVGGTGKYENARGYATVETLNLGEHIDRTTDGVDTILHFTVYLTE